MSEVIDTYTRQQAIEDGVLVDISQSSEAKEAGFKIPVAMTKALWGYIQVPKGMEGCQDLKGRLWDVCFLATTAFRNAKDKYLVEFEVLFQNAPEKMTTKKIWLVFNEHEGFTLMFPEDY